MFIDISEEESLLIDFKFDRGVDDFLGFSFVIFVMLFVFENIFRGYVFFLENLEVITYDVIILEFSRNVLEDLVFLGLEEFLKDFFVDGNVWFFSIIDMII